MTQPLLKWVGGKGKMLPKLVSFLPSDLNQRRHVEPFVGGGAMFFGLRPERSLISDINTNLISTYRSVVADPDEVVARLADLQAGHSKERYYEIRDLYNASRVDSQGTPEPDPWRAAMFIYLNKTCFNGVYRENKRGEFNVPIGSYKNPVILDEALVRRCAADLKKAVIGCSDFVDLVHNEVSRGDFVYFDPPYAPVSETSNFTGYDKSGFTLQDHTRLRDLCQLIHDRGCKFMVSNSDIRFVRDLYKDFKIGSVKSQRSINSDALGRGDVYEVVVTNY